MDTTQLLKIRRDELKAQVDEILARTAPQRQLRDDIIAQQNALGEQITALTEQINVHNDELAKANREHAAVVRALGALTLSGA